MIYLRDNLFNFNFLVAYKSEIKRPMSGRRNSRRRAFRRPIGVRVTGCCGDASGENRKLLNSEDNARVEQKPFVVD